jgi:anti-sigma B factor antagonist
VSFAKPHTQRHASDDPSSSRTDAGVVTVFARGEIDLATAPSLERDLCSAHREVTQEMVLDLAEVTFMDSVGVHLLLDAYERAMGGGYQFRLRHVPAQTQRLFSLAGFASLTSSV